MYTLDFNTEKGSKLYEIISQSVLLTKRPAAPSDWDTIVDLLREVKSCGKESGKLPDGTQLYDLAEPKRMNLDRTQHRLLLEMMEACHWKPASLPDVVDCRTWLCNQAWA